MDARGGGGGGGGGLLGSATVGGGHAHPSSAHAPSFIRLPPPPAPPRPAPPSTHHCARHCCRTPLHLPSFPPLSLSVSLKRSACRNQKETHQATGRQSGGSSTSIHPSIQSTTGPLFFFPCIKPNPVPPPSSARELTTSTIRPVAPFSQPSLHRCCRLDSDCRASLPLNFRPTPRKSQGGGGRSDQDAAVAVLPRQPVISRFHV